MNSEDQPLSSKQLLGMYQRSILGRWQIPPETKGEIHSFCMGVIKNPNESTRAKTGAAKVLASLASVESADNRGMVELTMKNEYAEATMPLIGDALASLLPPFEGESMTDDTPVGEQVIALRAIAHDTTENAERCKASEAGERAKA